MPRMGHDPSRAQSIVEGSGARARNPRGPIEPKESAQEAVRHLLGVKAVHNQIVVKPRASAAEVKPHIEAAFRRRAGLDGRKSVWRSRTANWSAGRMTLMGGAAGGRANGLGGAGDHLGQNLITVTPLRT